MAGCRGDGVPYSQLANGSNISVGGWGCRTVRLTTQGYDRRMVIFHCPLRQRTCTSVYVNKYSPPSRSHLNDLAAVAARVPDRDMLQRLLVARSRDEVALQPPSYTSGHFSFQDTARCYGTRSMLSRRSRFSERLEVTI